MIRVECDGCWASLTDSKSDSEYKSYRLYGSDTTRFITVFHFCNNCLGSKENFHVSIKNPDFKKPTE